MRVEPGPNIAVSDRARAFILERGETVYVFGTKKELKATTERPGDRSFNLEQKVNGVTVAIEDDLDYLTLDVRLSWPGEPQLYAVDLGDAWLGLE